MRPEEGDQLRAAADLGARAGARSFEIEHAIDDEAQWWATAYYQGTRVTGPSCSTPGAAAEALAVRLLTGARCRCGKLVAIGDDEAAFAYHEATLPTGERWTARQAVEAGQCRWRRQGARWEPSCDAPPVRLPRRS